MYTIILPTEFFCQNVFASTFCNWYTTLSEFLNLIKPWQSDEFSKAHKWFCFHGQLSQQFMNAFNVFVIKIFFSSGDMYSAINEWPSRINFSVFSCSAIYHFCKGKVCLRLNSWYISQKKCLKYCRLLYYHTFV